MLGGSFVRSRLILLSCLLYCEFDTLFLEREAYQMNDNELFAKILTDHPELCATALSLVIERLSSSSRQAEAEQIAD